MDDAKRVKKIGRREAREKDDAKRVKKLDDAKRVKKKNYAKRVKASISEFISYSSAFRMRLLIYTSEFRNMFALVRRGVLTRRERHERRLKEKTG